jgi:DedD protein
MDQALKARLIGASILVVLAVVLLPELLSGPKAPTGNVTAQGGKGTRTITIDLGGAVSAGAQVQPRAEPVPTPAAPTPLPAVTTPEPSTTIGADDPPIPDAGPETEPPESVPAPAAKPSVASPKTVEAKPAAASPPEPKATPAPGGFSVQVGAFGSIGGARKLVADLKNDGFPAYLLMPDPGKKLHRVRVGPVPDRAAADKLAARLKARGLPVSVVSGG